MVPNIEQWRQWGAQTLGPAVIRAGVGIDAKRKLRAVGTKGGAGALGAIGALAPCLTQRSSCA